MDASSNGELHPLKQWLEANGIRQNFVASKLGLHPATLTGALKGRHRLTAASCADYTDGAVTMRALSEWQERHVGGGA